MGAVAAAGLDRPVFLVVSAQAPLMQRWFAADSRAGDPISTLSNLQLAGSSAIRRWLKPNLPLATQSWGWTAGHALLVLLVAASAAGAGARAGWIRLRVRRRSTNHDRPGGASCTGC